MTYKMPDVFTSRSRNATGGSVLSNAGSQVFKSSSYWDTDRLVGQPSFNTAAKTARYGISTYNPANEETKNNLRETGMSMTKRGTTNSGVTPHFFQQVKDVEEYVATQSHRPATMISKDFPYLKTFIGREVQYDVDFFIRIASQFDVLFKKTWNLIDKMK
jgi:hypothetical protein